MRKFLIQAYPFQFLFRKTISFAFFISVFLFLFLYFLNPFGLTEEIIKIPYYLACLIYAVSTGLVIVLVNKILPRIFPKFFNEETWTIGKEILLVIILLIIISINIFFIGFYVDKQIQFSINTLLLELFNDLYHTLFIGIIPATIIILISYIILLKSNLNSSEALQEKLGLSANKDINNPQINIESKVKNDNFSLLKNDLILIQADGNYLHFYIQNDTEINKIISRNTLVFAEEKVTKFSNFVKTHRSFIVNLDYIKKIKGNAQGYQLTFENIDFTVPVSRTRLKEFDGKINAIYPKNL